jgi:hypothetical protein
VFRFTTYYHCLNQWQVMGVDYRERRLKISIRNHSQQQQIPEVSVNGPIVLGKKKK